MIHRLFSLVLPFSLLGALLGPGCAFPPSDPPWCKAVGPLEAECAGPRCVAGVVVDYTRLEPRGYRTFTLSGSAVTRREVQDLCMRHVTEVLGAEPPTLSDADLAGEFFNCFLSYPNLDTWLVTVHAPTGQVVFADLEIWANPQRNADPPLLEGWLDPAPLGCTDGAAEPAAQPSLRTTGFPMGSAPASTAAEAWAVAKRLNLVEQLTADRPYRVMVVSHSQATGEFDPETADWYVWISLTR